MRKGRQEILRRYHDDSHTRNLTDVLWPSASLREAAYSPDKIFTV
jgi:hypothetical protein